MTGIDESLSGAIGRALLHAAWSLPWGLAAGWRAASAAADHSSVAAGWWLFRGGVLATSLLVHAALLVVASLAAAVVERWLRRWSPLPFGDVQHAVSALALAAGAMLEASLLGRREGAAILVAAGLAAAFAWRGSALRGRDAAGAASAVAALVIGAAAFLTSPKDPLGAVPPLLAALAAGGLAARVRGLRPRRWRGAAGAAAAACVVLALASLGVPLVPEGDAAPGGPLVLVVTVDTLRADAAPWGSTQTPHLDALARESVRFTQCRAPAPWTDPSLDALVHAGDPPWSLVRGSLPARTVLTNRGGSRAHRPSYHGTIHETADLGPAPLMALVQLPALRRLARTEHRAFAFGHARADAVADAAIAHLRASRGGPLLLWAHFIDPHAPYDPPPRFRAGGVSDRLSGLFSAQMRRGRVATRAEQRALADLYRGEVRFVDEQVGRLLQAVRDEGRWDEATVAFTADHGEELFERDDAGHGHSLHDELLRVPLLVKLPRGAGAGRVVDDPVALQDLGPTLAALRGDPLPAPGPRAGRDLGPLLRGQALPPRPQAFSNLLFGPQQQAVLAWPFKLVREPESGRERLFDLASDPGELSDAAAAHPDQLLSLRALAGRLHGEAKGGLPQELGEQELEALRALGYVR